MTQLARRRVLIVDDNRDTADSLAMYLQMCGHEVAAAYSGADAIRNFESSAFDWVLLDIGMPNPDGYEIARIIRRAPSGATVQLVALTGWGTDSDKHLSIEAGFNYHFTKPTPPAILADLLEIPQMS